MKGLIAEFKKFISRGNVVDMAVGVAVAGAFTKIVTAFTNGFIGPILALLTNDANLTEFKWVVRAAETEMVDGVETIITPEVAILWGAFLQTILDFLIIALSLFIVMKVFNSATAKAKAMQAEMLDEMKPKKLKKAEAEKAAAEAAAKAAEEEAAKVAAEAAAAKAAEEEQARLASYAAQVAVSENTEKLLTEIRDLLKSKNA
ncbi:MAG: large conductance mechanosensitive channel protein MscL [Clostridia bacterium]|nr:large conductance mechanosensitive channel protein MscL [Clostridia bacterium]